MSNKRIKRSILIILLIIIALIPVAYISLKKYQQYQYEQEQLRIEQERIEAERKEQERIANLPISKTIYLTIDEKYYGNFEILNNNEICTLKNEYVTASTVGECTIYDKNEDKKYIVSVSNLYSLAHIDNYKENIFVGAYSQEEAEYLDKVLKERINEVGYQTRAAVVEAARFLSMMFEYKIPYFCENGRLSGTNTYADGEGRYYHEGLYLSEDKFELLDPNGIINGPQIWGGYMHHSCGVLLKPNGLDCSGFVSWCLVQAGFDPGDYGAGSNDPGNDYCLADLANGDAGAIWLDEIDPNEIQAGDIIAWAGTTAIIVGVDDENIYTAHQYWDNGLEVVTDSKISLKDYPYGEDCGDWQYVSLMDNYYETNGNGQGKYTAMWQK